MLIQIFTKKLYTEVDKFNVSVLKFDFVLVFIKQDFISIRRFLSI